MVRIVAFALLMSGALTSLSFQDPKQVRVQIQWIDTSLDVWEELRQVDTAFKRVSDEVARLAKALEADEIETRTKAASELKGLGLTAYGPIKSARDKAASAEVRSQLDAVLKALAADFDPALASVPGARRIGAAESRALQDRLKERKVARHTPFMTLRDGQRGSIFVGDASPGARVRSITIEGDGESARLENEGPLFKTGLTIDVLPKVEGAKGKVTLEIKANARAAVGLDPTEVNVRLAPLLAVKEGFLAGPFPSADGKGDPWWIFVTECQVFP